MKLSLIAIGISEYRDPQLGKIPCAYQDSQMIYDAFKSIMGDGFSESTSICVKDITSSNFGALLNGLKYTYTSPEDTLVIYFSGHAINKRGNSGSSVFSLCCKDYSSEESDNAIPVEDQIISGLRNVGCNIVLILDCCYSGAALINATHEPGAQQISILCSTNERSLSEFTEDGSRYAKAVCESIFEIKAKNTDFSLENLQSKIYARYKNACCNAASTHTGSILLKRATPYEDMYYDFSKRFFKQLNDRSVHYREAIWYSLCDIPSKLTIDLFREYFKCTNPDSHFAPEANWLVRRAIGSAIACIEDHVERQNLNKTLLKSVSWQEQCIGIIGARYDIKNNDHIFRYTIDLIRTRRIKRIDAIWLINLYAADNVNYDYSMFLTTSLAEQPWGIHEIWKTAKGISFDVFYQKLEEHHVKHAAAWKTDYYERHPWQESSTLYGCFSDNKARGRLPVKTKSKFILSLLFGNWRGHTMTDLRALLDNMTSEERDYELCEAAGYTETEYKMALFDFFASEPEWFAKCKESLLWGLQDMHPWVRRTAIQAFKTIGFESAMINESILNYIRLAENHIGIFDLILEYEASCVEDVKSLIDELEHLGYTSADIKSVEASFSF
ncbi:MAG: caspase family protein [Oscillospiraceae bacterium]|nr:caspase family protein [Oscillospiraceae bacterium]